MFKRITSGLTIFFIGGILFTLSAWCLWKTPERYSESERRALTTMPELSVSSILNGTFTGKFETYAADQFPLRDRFRSLKSFAEFNLFQKTDSNDLYLMDGHISKLEPEINTAMLDHAAERFSWIYETYLKEHDRNLYFSIIPDKNKFLAAQNGYPAMDYAAFEQYMREKTDYMQYIDISELLTIDDFYKTDTHWKQECIVDIAEKFLQEMGITSEDSREDYIQNVSETPFYGVYYGQAALSLPPDTLTYLTNETLDSCIVTSYDTGTPVSVPLYDLDAAKGKDPYEMFTSGSDALITIENPNADTDRELILFRDSFGSSIAPLFVRSYTKITLVDIRYIQSSMLKNFIDFENQDVLFLYSTLLLNSSMGMR